MKARFPLLYLVCLGTLLLSANAATFSYADLASRLTDLKALATPPQPGEKAGLASSYDRKSRYDESNDKYIDWAAIWDTDGMARMEGDSAVMADIQGPGCIWRIWSAAPNGKAGHVKIYLDESTTPAVDLPFTAYFDGSQEPFNRPALVYKINNGFDNFTPIPFQKSCKIIGEKGWGAYYHFNYTQFAPGTVLPTFHLPLTTADGAALDHVNDLLLHAGQNPTEKSPTDQIIRESITAEPGKTTVVYDGSGSGAITGIRVKFDTPAEIVAQRALLRQIALRITWDNQSQPSVWSPLGDFFGSPAAAIPFDSLTTGLGKDGYWYCYWYMPFESHATLSIDNDGSTALPMEWEITRAKLTQNPSRLLRFHAKWHRDAFLPARPDRNIDWTLLTTQGKGRYVGTQLHVWNPRGGWWGEGDEKFFVDGEKFPSIFGTGSEDYFGYAWSSGGRFTKPLHGQPYTENGVAGHISDFRWHISDNIPFQTSFEGAIEKYLPNDNPTLYASVAYWYLDPSGADPYPAVPVSERVGFYVRPPVYHAPNVIEAENLIAISNPPGGLRSRKTSAAVAHFPAQVVFPSHAASDDAVLTAIFRVIGQKYDFGGLKVEKAGIYNLQARIFKSPSSGIVQFSVDGKPVGSSMDLYSTKSAGENAQSSDSIVDLGKLELSACDHVLSVTFVGKNENAKVDWSNCFVCYLDYLKLEPIQ